MVNWSSLIYSMIAAPCTCIEQTYHFCFSKSYKSILHSSCGAFLFTLWEDWYLSLVIIRNIDSMFIYIYCCHIVWKLALIIAIASHCDWVQQWQVLLWRLLLLLHHLHHHRLRRHRPGYFSVFWEILHGVETNPVPRSDITTRMYLSSLLFSVFSHQWWVISGCTNWPKKLEHSLFSYLAQIVGQNEGFLYRVFFFSLGLP